MMMMIFVGTLFGNLHRDANGLYLRQTGGCRSLRRGYRGAAGRRQSGVAVPDVLLTAVTVRTVALTAATAASVAREMLAWGTTVVCVTMGLQCCQW